MLVNYIRAKHKCSNEKIHTHLWNMRNNEFEKAIQPTEEEMDWAERFYQKHRRIMRIIPPILQGILLAICLYGLWLSVMK